MIINTDTLTLVPPSFGKKEISQVSQAELGTIRIISPDGESIFTDQYIDFGAYGVTEVWQNVKYILITEYFSVPLDREFGMQFTMVDKPIPIAEAMLSQEVAIKIAMYEPRCQFTEIKYDGSGIAGKLNPTVVIDILSTEELPSRVGTAPLLPGVPLPVITVGQDVDSFVQFLIEVASKQGPEGPKGDAATVECGDTITGEPGTMAEVENVGTSFAAVFEFTIPRGDKGSNAYTLVVHEFLVPEVGETIDVIVEDAEWITVGEMLWVEGANGDGEAGELKVIAKNGNTITLQTPTPSKTVEEAPADGGLYGRRNERWEVVPAGGGGGETPPSDVTYDLGQHVPVTAYLGEGTLGVHLTFASDGYISEVSFYKAELEIDNVNHAWILWDMAGVPIANFAPDSETAAIGWIRHKIPIPLPITAGDYVLGVHVSTGYVIDDLYLPYTDGPLTANSGRYITGNGFPTTDKPKTYYGIDLIFSTELGGGGGGIPEAPIDGKQYARQDSSWTEVTIPPKINYSLNEQDTGITWIDGKIIYQKTINIGKLGSAPSRTLYPHGIDLDFLVELNMIAREPTAPFSIPVTYTGYVNLNGVIGVFCDKTNINVDIGSDRSAYIGYVTLRYTKHPAPILTSLTPSQGPGDKTVVTVQAIGSGFTAQCKGYFNANLCTSTTFVSATELTLVFTCRGQSSPPVWIQDEYGQKSNEIGFFGGPM